jgi:hypothetical protein
MSTKTTPLIEQLLDTAHAELAVLQETSRSLAHHGMTASDLPQYNTLVATAVLGEHGRAQVEESLREHWAGLIDKGLTHGDLTAHSTPHLRLLLMVQPATESLAGLRSRMETEVTQAAPQELFRCAPVVADLMWGQPVRLDYQIGAQAEYLLIVPSRAIRRMPVLIHTGHGAGHGNIDLPGDEGEVVFTVMGRDGQIYRHTTVLKLRDADWLTRSVA